MHADVRQFAAMTRFNKMNGDAAHRLKDLLLDKEDGVGVVLLLGLAVQLVRAVVAHLGDCQRLQERLEHIRHLCRHQVAICQAVANEAPAETCRSMYAHAGH